MISKGKQTEGAEIQANPIGDKAYRFTTISIGIRTSKICFVTNGYIKFIERFYILHTAINQFFN
jgi:hypothetical protein